MKAAALCVTRRTETVPKDEIQHTNRQLYSSRLSSPLLPLSATDQSQLLKSSQLSKPNIAMYICPIPLGWVGSDLLDQVSVVMEQTLRLFHHCGVPTEDLDFINCDGPVMHG